MRYGGINDSDRLTHDPASLGMSEAVNESHPLATPQPLAAMTSAAKPSAGPPNLHRHGFWSVPHFTHAHSRHWSGLKENIDDVASFVFPSNARTLLVAKLM
eukprot:Gb_11795 [translate_table: standard]